MARKIEPLNGGLVTDKDPALLTEGQLSDIRNMVYKGGGVSLERATGRAVFGAVSAVATGVVGLRDMHFDNGDHYLVARAGAKLRTSPVADTGTFTDMAVVTDSGLPLEAVQYRNRFFFFTGASADASSIGTNVVAYLTATAASNPIATRTHGLLPVNAAPNITTAAGVFSQTVTGYYEYWTTEVLQYTQDGASAELESAYSSDNGVSTVFISTTAVVPTVQQPTIRNLNPRATHWRIYRSAKKDKESDKLFPVGFMISELSTAVLSHADTTAAASASAFPTQFNSSGAFFGFASASSMASDNTVYASGIAGANPLVPIEQGSYAFSLSAVSGAVRGIEVEVQGYISAGSGPVPVKATIGRRRASDGGFDVSLGGIVGGGLVTASKSGSISSTNSASPTTFVLGSPTDRWFPTDKKGLVDTDMTALMVVLSISKPSVSVGIDYIKVTIHYAASVESTVQFPTVVYTFGDITSQVAKNFPPPSSSTGDLYQDSLVVNDVSNPSLVRWSSPGEPEYFPPTYFIDFETKENDRVTAVRVVNNRLMIGMEGQMWRMNYLPSERDSSFDRGKAVEIVSRSYGVSNAMCCTTFTIDGVAEEMAFVSDKGIHTTDGFNCMTRSKSLNWRNILALTGTSTPIALLNDPENRCLRFFYRNDALTPETYMCLFASYDRADIDQEGNFKFSGPVHMRNFDSGSATFGSLESAWALTRSNGDTAFYMGYGGTNTAPGAGKVYYETGTTIPSQDSTCQYTTRRIYAAGMSGEWKLDDVYGYCGSYTGAPQLIYTFKGVKTNDTGETTRGTKSITLAGQKLHRLTPQVQSEGLRVTMQATASAFSQEMLILGSQDFGLEDSGR